MVFHANEKKLIAIFSIALMFSGCSGKSDNTTTTHSVATSYKKEAKPGALVKMVSPSIISINPSQLTQINIELETSGEDGDLELDFLPSQGLDIGNTPKHQTVSLSNTPLLKIPVTLFAHADGRYYLNMHVRISNSESSSTRTLALIVQAGAETGKNIQFKKPADENVVSLPAEEKISSQ